MSIIFIFAALIFTGLESQAQDGPSRRLTPQEGNLERAYATEIAPPNLEVGDEVLVDTVFSGSPAFSRIPVGMRSDDCSGIALSARSSRVCKVYYQFLAPAYTPDPLSAVITITSRHFKNISAGPLAPVVTTESIAVTGVVQRKDQTTLLYDLAIETLKVEQPAGTPLLTNLNGQFEMQAGIPVVVTYSAKGSLPKEMQRLNVVLSARYYSDQTFANDYVAVPYADRDKPRTFTFTPGPTNQLGKLEATVRIESTFLSVKTLETNYADNFKSLQAHVSGIDFQSRGAVVSQDGVAIQRDDIYGRFPIDLKKPVRVAFRGELLGVDTIPYTQFSVSIKNYSESAQLVYVNRFAYLNRPFEYVHFYTPKNVETQGVDFLANKDQIMLESRYDNNAHSVTLFGRPEKAKVVIESVRIGQVIWDPQNPITQAKIVVAGKRFAPAIKFKASPAPINDSLVITYTANNLTLYSQKFKRAYFSEPRELIIKEFHGISPATGKQTLRFTVRNEQGETESSFNHDVEFIETRRLDVALFTVAPYCPSAPCYEEVNKNRLGGNFESAGPKLNKILPVPDESVEFINTKTPISGSANRTVVADGKDKTITRGMLIDLANVGFAKRTVRAYGLRYFERGIGVVGAGYFKNHTPEAPDVDDWTGVAKGASALIDDRQESNVGHELIHTFVGQLEICNEDYDDCANVPTMDGYDALSERTVDSTSKSIMLGNRDWDDVWIDKRRYGLTLATFLKKPVDPEILVVSGILNKSGEFELLKTLVLPDGYIDESSGNNVSIRTLDRNDKVLNTLTLSEDFKIHIEKQGSRGHGGYAEFEATPVSFAIKFDAETDSVSISLNGLQSNRFEPLKDTLRTVIAAIPHNAFKSLPALTSKVMLAEVAIIEGFIKQKKFAAAAVLTSVLHEEVNKLTKSYDGISNLYGKTDSLKIIKMVGRSLVARAKIN